MSNEFNNLDPAEKLKAENDFLKMKMMLEHGADIHFSGVGPPEMENDFLKRIMDFESHYSNRVYTTVYKKIGSPTHFKPVSLIHDDEIETAYENLVNYMNENGVDLTCCSPNVSTRELYRFVIEELFAKEIADITMPGMISAFIYDEFYPDHEYDNTRVALVECLGYIFSKRPFDHVGHLEKDGLQVNGYAGLSEKEVQSLINRFKDLFDDIQLRYAEAENCKFTEPTCTIDGKYGVDLVTSNVKMSIDDNWSISFKYHKDLGYWYVTSLQLGGINL